jgi:hypothetical protein
VRYWYKYGTVYSLSTKLTWYWCDLGTSTVDITDLSSRTLPCVLLGAMVGDIVDSVNQVARGTGMVARDGDYDSGDILYNVIGLRD